MVIDSSDFQKPATDKYNIDYYKIVNGNQLTFTGSGNTSGSLTVRNDDNDRVNSYFFASGSATKIIFSKFNTFNVLTDTKFTHYVFHNDESDLTKDTGPNDQTPFMVNDGGQIEISDIHEVNFGLKDKPLEVDSATNLYGAGSKLTFKTIDNFNSYTKASAGILVQADSTLSYDNVKNIYITNEYAGTSGVRSAVQLFCNSDGSAVKPASFSITNAETVVLHGTLSNTNSGAVGAGIVVNDRGGEYSGVKSANLLIQAKVISVYGSDLGIFLTRSSPDSGSTNIQLEAEKNLAISVDADSSYGDAVRLTNKTGDQTDVSLKSPEVSIQGNIIATRSNTNISADTAVINGNVTLNDAESGLRLSNHSEKTANTILNGDVSSLGSISLANQNLVQESGNFKSESLTADNSSLTFNTVEKGGIAIQKLNGDLKLRAGSKVTETYGTASAALNAIKNDIISTNSEALMKGFTGGEASDLTAAWEYNPESGSVTTLGDASGLSPTLVAAKKTAGANLAQWRYEINHLSERLGEVRNLQGTAGTWARVYGAEAKLEDSVSTKVKANTIQVGADVRVGDNWIVGGAFGYTDSKADFSNGDSSTDSFNFAAYGTAFFPCGGYVDLIARVGRMSTDVDVATVTDFKSSYDNTTFGVSAEVGYRWDISKTFYLTPQAELSYGLVKGADYTAANEIRVDQDDFQTLVGRLGFQAGMNVADGAGTVYLTASVNHDFQGESDAYARRGDSAVQKLSEDLGGTWVSYGFGGQINVKDNWSFYGSLTRANGSDYQENYRYSVGTRYCW